MARKKTRDVIISSLSVTTGKASELGALRLVHTALGIPTHPFLGGYAHGRLQWASSAT